MKKCFSSLFFSFFFLFCSPPTPLFLIGGSSSPLVGWAVSPPSLVKGGGLVALLSTPPFRLGGLHLPFSRRSTLPSCFRSPPSLFLEGSPSQLLGWVVSPPLFFGGLTSSCWLLGLSPPPTFLVGRSPLSLLAGRSLFTFLVGRSPFSLFGGKKRKKKKRKKKKKKERKKKNKGRKKRATIKGRRFSELSTRKNPKEPWHPSLSHKYVFVAGCGSDNGRNFVAATATGLVDSLEVELFRCCRICGSLTWISEADRFSRSS